MCYSAQIEAGYERYVRAWGARISLADFTQLYLSGIEKARIKTPKVIDAAFASPQTGQDRQIKAAIEQRNADQVTKLEKYFFKQKMLQCWYAPIMITDNAAVLQISDGGLEALSTLSQVSSRDTRSRRLWRTQRTISHNLYPMQNQPDPTENVTQLRLTTPTMTPFDWAKYHQENPPEEMTAEQHRKANRFHFGKDWEMSRPDLLQHVLTLEDDETRRE